MAEVSPLAGLPAGGIYPLDFSSAFLSTVGVKGDDKPEESIGLKYAFKPASISKDTPGLLEMNKGRSSTMTFDTQKGSSAVFDVREEPAKARECVLVWNPETASFSIHPLFTTLHLTVNRNLSGQPPAKRKSLDEAPPLVAAPKKKSRPSEVVPPPTAAKPSKGGKTLPKAVASVGRKSLPAATVKTVTTAGGKYKSSEIIASDEDDEMDGEEEDDFATMLGAEMAQPDIGTADDDDDDEEEEEESDDELGGAKLVAEAHTEWI